MSECRIMSHNTNCTAFVGLGTKLKLCNIFVFSKLVLITQQPNEIIVTFCFLFLPVDIH